MCQPKHMHVLVGCKRHHLPTPAYQPKPVLEFYYQQTCNHLHIYSPQMAVVTFPCLQILFRFPFVYIGVNWLLSCIHRHPLTPVPVAYRAMLIGSKHPYLLLLTASTTMPIDTKKKLSSHVKQCAIPVALQPCHLLSKSSLVRPGDVNWLHAYAKGCQPIPVSCQAISITHLSAALHCFGPLQPCHLQS